jgi:hypothetical protein
MEYPMLEMEKYPKYEMEKEYTGKAIMVYMDLLGFS